MFIFGAWNTGASLFVYDDRGQFSAKRFLEIQHAPPMTNLCAPPLAWRQLSSRQMRQYYHEHPQLSLRHCASAGEALNEEVIVSWKRRSGLAIHDGYGRTETILLCGNSDTVPVRPGSMGKPPSPIPLCVIDV